MNRKFFLLNGLAILAVVVNHAAGWGFTAMFWWADRYLPVQVPYYEPLGNGWYYLLVVLKQLTVFSVPAFLFVSGLFVNYAGGSSGKNFGWKIVLARLQGLLPAYLLWSIVFFALEIMDNGFTPVSSYILRLLTGQAINAFFFVPVLVQLYILSVWLVGFARRHPVLVLAVSAAIQVVALVLRYGELNAEGYGFIQWAPPNWTFVHWIFYFTAGIVFSQHQSKISSWLAKYRVAILSITILLAVLAVVEPESRFRLTDNDAWRGTSRTFSTLLYCSGILLTYLAFEKISIPFSKQFYLLGSRSYGIYLVHYLVMIVVARLTYHFLPGLLGQPLLFLLALVIAGAAVPFYTVEVLQKTPLRAHLRLLFG